MKKIFLMLVALFMFVACSGGKENKVYVVGTNAEYPPFEYMEDGKISGLDAEIIEEISKRIGMKYKWSNMNFDGLIPALQTKKIDVVIAGMSATPEREKAVSFSIPYLVSNATIITNKSNPIKDMNDLSGKSYGVELGTTKEVSARKIVGANVVPFSSNTGALVALKSNKIDGMVLDESVAKKFVENNQELVIVGNLTGEPKAIAFNKDSKELKEKYDKVIDEMLKDGTVAKLKEKYGL